MTRERVLAVAVVCLSLAGCGVGGSTTPVPLEAKAPFLCTGVPREGVELLSGARSLQVSEGTGGWGAEEDSFACFVRVSDADEGVISVTREPLDWHGSASAQEYLEQFEGTALWTPIDGEGPGAGYAAQETPGSATAQWICGDDRVIVNAFMLAGGDRDPVEDVGRLMLSMLPWACGEAEAPERTRE